MNGRLSTSSALLVLGMVATAAGLVPAPLPAQGTQTGGLAGTVTDTEGTPLPGITVTASSPALMGERATQTTGTGDYVIRSLPPGSYKTVYELDGMTTVERSATVELGLTSRIDVTMGLAAVAESLVVVATAITALENTQIGANFDAETVDALPIARSPVDIASLAAGLSNNAPQAGQVTISGAFGYDSAFLVDGVDINDPVYGSPVVDGLAIDQGLYIEEAIQETQVLTSAISAEYGRFTGGVVNAITRSGGNRFHGSVRVDLTDPAWRDETPLEDSLGLAHESNRNEVLSATLGGPILENRLWFFGAYRDHQTTDSIVLPITNFLVPQDFDDRRWELKLTGNIQDRHTLRLTTLDSDTAFTTISFPGVIDRRSVMTQRYPGDLLVGDYSGTVGANLLLEVRYSEKNQNIVKGGTSRDLRDVPIRSPLRHYYNAPVWDATEPENRDNEQLTGSLSWFLSGAGPGSHDLKVGIEEYTSTRGGSLNFSSADHLLVGTPYVADAQGQPILDGQGRLQPIFNPATNVLVKVHYLRGGQRDIRTRSFYVNDAWRLDEHWTINLGVRYEDVLGRDSTGVTAVDTDLWVPRLAVSFDPRGDGRFKLGASLAKYSGAYNQSFYHGRSLVAQPGITLLLYVGPPGVGVDFAPGFDLSNYISIPGGSLVHGGLAASVHTPVIEELTLSAGMRLGDRGYLEASLVDRSLTDMPTTLTSVEFGSSTISLPDGTFQVLDNELTVNADLARRDYRAIQVQGRYRLKERWQLEGNWTYQIKNHGNYEGESVSFAAFGPRMGAYPELASPGRNFPGGRLDDFQRHRIRAWTTWGRELGRAGDLDLALLFRFDSARTYSLSADVGFSPVQISRDPGYANPPHGQTIFFGPRGSGEFEDVATFDLAAVYRIAAGKRFEPWIKLDILNLFNDRKLVSWNTSIIPDPTGSLDADGLPNQFVEAPTFGQAQSAADFVKPREYRVALGVRF